MCAYIIHVCLFVCFQSVLLQEKDHSILSLKGKVAEVMALLPAASAGFAPVVINSSSSPLPNAPSSHMAAYSGSYTPPSSGSSHSPSQCCGGDTFTPPPASSAPTALSTPANSAATSPGSAGGEEDVLSSSSLNPMASDYTPNTSR